MRNRIQRYARMTMIVRSEPGAAPPPPGGGGGGGEYEPPPGGGGGVYDPPGGGGVAGGTVGGGISLISSPCLSTRHFTRLYRHRITSLSRPIAFRQRVEVSP